MLPANLFLTGTPNSSPGNLVSLFRTNHADFADFVHECFIVLNDAGKASGNVGVIESKALPHCNTAVFVHFLNVLLDSSRGKFHTLDNGSIVQNHSCPGNRQRLLQHNSGIIGNLSHAESAKSIHSPGIAGNALSLRSIEGLENANNKVFRIAPLTTSRPGFFRRTEDPVQFVPDASILVIVEPFERIQDGKSHGMILCHAGHVICEHIEDAVDHNSVFCILDCFFRKAHIEKSIQAGSTGIFVRRCFQMPSIGIDWEVVRLSEEVLTKAFQAHIIAPLAALVLHELLKLVCNLNLPRGKLSNDLPDLLRGQFVPGVRNFFPLIEERRHSDAISYDMPERLSPLAKRIQ